VVTAVPCTVTVVPLGTMTCGSVIGVPIVRCAPGGTSKVLKTTVPPMFTFWPAATLGPPAMVHASASRGSKERNREEALLERILKRLV
jgi:hypothetical protein